MLTYFRKKPEQNQQASRSKQEDKTDEPQEEYVNKGTLKIDATVADQEIKYPNDVALLNDSRLQL